MSQKQNRKPENILIATVGASPAVVTETLWALMNPEKLRSGRHRERFVPDTVHVVTTSYGEYLSNRFDLKGRIDELYRQQGEKPPALHVDVPYMDGEAIGDIRTQRENIAYADHLTKVMRNYTADPNTTVHVSIAGGRKTMTSFGHTALMFFGRAQDELSHVLVEPPVLERCPDFFWPEQPGEDFVLDPDNNPVPIRGDKVTLDLVATPFPRLRYLLPEDMQLPGADISYQDIVKQVQAALEADRLVIDMLDRQVRVGDCTFQLSPSLFMIYALLAWVAKTEHPGAGPDGVGPQHRGWMTWDMLLDPNSDIARRLRGRIRVNEDSDDILDELEYHWSIQDENEREENEKYLKDKLSQMKSKMNRAIKKHIKNPILFDRIQVKQAKSQKVSRFGLLLRPSQIEIIE